MLIQAFLYLRYFYQLPFHGFLFLVQSAYGIVQLHAYLVQAFVEQYLFLVAFFQFSPLGFPLRALRFIELCLLACLLHLVPYLLRRVHLAVRHARIQFHLPVGCSLLHVK